jgi:hypothetical protein
VAKNGNILNGVNGAAGKFGLRSNHGDKLTAVPKFADQWFIEFHMDGADSRASEEYASKVRSVSDISINTTYNTIDQYGKRIHVPTRVDFPEVTMQLYDVVDGKTFMLMRRAYEANFKNNSLNTDSDLDSAIRESNSGLKFTNHSQQQNHFFRKVVVYHFYGAAEEGNGFIQKIELINPVVSNISFSGSDYSSTDLRTVDVTLAPENVVIREAVSSATWPDWMRLGLEYLGELENSGLGNGAARFDNKSAVERLERISGTQAAVGFTNQANRAVASGATTVPNILNTFRSGLFGALTSGTQFNLGNVAARALGSIPNQISTAVNRAVPNLRTALTSAAPTITRSVRDAQQGIISSLGSLRRGLFR